MTWRGEEQNVYKEASGEMIQKLSGFILREAAADRFFGNFACGLGVQLVPLGKVLIVCQVGHGGLEAGRNHRACGLDHNAPTAVDSIGEPEQGHRAHLMVDINSGKEWSAID